MIDLDSLQLSKGIHKDRGDGVCLLEAAAWFAGEPHSDHPVCVCPTLGIFGRSLNDSLPFSIRQKLKAYVPRMIGTAGDGAQDVRRWMATNWLVHICAPEFLDVAGLTEQADTLRRLPEILDSLSVIRVQQVILDINQKVTHAMTSSYDIFWSHLWNTARKAITTSGCDSASVTITSFGRAFIGNTIKEFTLNAARLAVESVANGVSNPTSKTIAQDQEAAKKTLAPTVDRLQQSVFDLFERMIDAGKA